MSSRNLTKKLQASVGSSLDTGWRLYTDEGARSPTKRHSDDRARTTQSELSRIVGQQPGLTEEQAGGRLRL